MTVCYFPIYSFPAIDFSLTLRSAIVQPQHEKSRFSILMSFIPNKRAAHQNYPVTVRISILRILQRSEVLLLQIIPCRIVHTTAHSLSTVKSHVYPPTAKVRLAPQQRTHVQITLNSDFVRPLTKEESVLDLSKPYMRWYCWLRCWQNGLMCRCL